MARSRAAERNRTARAPTNMSGDRLFRLLVEGVSDCAIYLLSAQGIVTTWNSGAARLKNYSAAEVIGRHFEIFYTAEDRADGLPGRALAIALRDGKYQAESWSVRQDGRRFWA